MYENSQKSHSVWSPQPKQFFHVQTNRVYFCILCHIYIDQIVMTKNAKINSLRLNMEKFFRLGRSDRMWFLWIFIQDGMRNLHSHKNNSHCCCKCAWFEVIKISRKYVPWQRDPDDQDRCNKLELSWVKLGWVLIKLCFVRPS